MGGPFRMPLDTCISIRSSTCTSQGPSPTGVALARADHGRMNTTMASHWWLGRFADRLLQLNPRANWRSAVRRAVANYHRAAYLQPDDAADMFYCESLRSQSTRTLNMKPAEHRMAASTAVRCAASRTRSAAG